MRTTMTLPRNLGRTIAAGAAALLLAAGSLLIATPANAHDELVSSDPATGAALEALPSQLVLTFSAEITTEQGATQLQVTDAAGTSLTDGEPVVEGTTVTQALAGDASGAVTVLWKVVSSDGHPISGELGFTVAAPPTPTPTATPTATPTPTETASAEPTPTPTEVIAPVSNDGNAALPWIIGGVFVLAVGGAVAYLLVSRNRRNRALAARPGAPGSSDSEPSADR